MKLAFGFFIAAFITGIFAMVVGDWFVVFINEGIALIALAMAYMYWYADKEELRFEELHRQDRERRWK